MRKRRRRSSSTIFDLEPAEFVGPRVVRDIDHADFQNIKVKSKALRPSNSPSHPCRNSSSASSEKFRLLRKDTKDYERKPRRKTREDRYELKRSKPKKKTREDQKENAARKKAIRNRKLKTGTTLMHEFVAQNVMHDRLTVRAIFVAKDLPFK